MSQNPDPTIRRANVDDLDLLAELGGRTFSETFAAENTSEDIAAYLAASFNVARQTAELADPASTFFIAEVGGLAAGYAKLHAGEPPEGIEGAKALAKNLKALLDRFPDHRYNAEELRQLKAEIYKLMLSVMDGKKMVALTEKLLNLVWS